MNSWRLFTFAIVFWEAYENPIFLREADHKPLWYRSAQRVMRVRPLMTTITVVSVLLWFVVILYFKNLLLFLLLPRFLLVTATGLTLAPIVVDERAKQSWETLLVAPFSPQEVLLGKVGGALWWLRYVLLAMSALLFLVAMGVGFIAIALIPTSLPGMDEAPIFVLCFGVVVFPVVWSVAFVIDRIQQFLLAVTAAVVVSTTATSTRSAFFSALSAIMIAWAVEVIFVGVALAFQPGRTTIVADTNFLSLITLGPVLNFIVEFDLFQAVFWTGCTLTAREFGIRLLWRLAIRQARAF